MKVTDVGLIVEPISPERERQIVPKDVPATLQLYLDGLCRSARRENADMFRAKHT